MSGMWINGSYPVTAGKGDDVITSLSICDASFHVSFMSAAHLPQNATGNQWNAALPLIIQAADIRKCY